jgi:hypothetical protein
VGPTQPPIQWVQKALSPGLKRPWHETYQSPPASAEEENVNLYIHSPIRLDGVVLNWFYFTLPCLQYCYACKQIEGQCLIIGQDGFFLRSSRFNVRN